jgi:hypothetical protein
MTSSAGIRSYEPLPIPFAWPRNTRIGPLSDPRVQCWLKTAKQRFQRRDSDLDHERPLFDEIDAEINDIEC